LRVRKEQASVAARPSIVIEPPPEPTLTVFPPLLLRCATSPVPAPIKFNVEPPPSALMISLLPTPKVMVASAPAVVTVVPEAVVETLTLSPVPVPSLTT